MTLNPFVLVYSDKINKDIKKKTWSEIIAETENKGTEVSLIRLGECIEFFIRTDSIYMVKTIGGIETNIENLKKLYDIGGDRVRAGIREKLIIDKKNLDDIWVMSVVLGGI